MIDEKEILELAEIAIKELKKNQSGGYDLDLLIGLNYEKDEDENKIERVEKLLISHDLISRETNGVWLTNKGLEIESVQSCLTQQIIKEKGDLDSKKNASFDWRHRWFKHPFTTFIYGLIVGKLVDYFVGF